MKSINILVVIILSLATTSCSKQTWEISTSSSCTMNEPINTDYSKAAPLQSIMDHYVQQGVPGISLAVYSNEGWWAGASGYSKIENKTLMQPCHLQYSQSVSKTYLSVAILKLYDGGRINLDEKITNYLPQDVISKISDADQITVRMLMNHTSGIPEYNDDADYVSYLLQHPLHVFTTSDYLNYIAGKPLLFTPGSKYKYVNTNYEVLALIGDYITGDHAKFIRDSIFTPLGLVNSYYHDDANYLNNPDLVNSYWDRYSNGAIENVSQMQQVNVASLIGDDGLIASPIDYVKFLKALFNDEIISQASLDQMLTFVKDDKGEEKYGLGIFHLVYNNHVVYGHGGGGIGAGCSLIYFPEENVYFFLSVNFGVIIDGPITDLIGDMQDEINDVLVP